MDIMKELGWLVENAQEVITAVMTIVGIVAMIRTQIANRAETPWGKTIFVILDTIAMNWGKARNANEQDPVTGELPTPDAPTVVAGSSPA